MIATVPQRPKTEPIPEPDKAAKGASTPLAEDSEPLENPTPQVHPPLADPSPEPIEEPDVEPEPDEEPAELAADDVCPICGGAGTLGFEPPMDPTAHRCPDCDGIGMVLTGSKVMEYATRPCARCEGKGFVQAPGTVAGVNLGGVPPAASTTAEWFDKDDPATWTLPTRPNAWDASAA